MGNKQSGALTLSVKKAASDKAKVLTIEDADIGDHPIPPIFTQLSGLEKLTLRNTKMSKLPDAVFGFKNLVMLNLAGNLFDRLPAGVAQLDKLRVLNLSENKLKQLPAELGKLQCLETLDVSKNQLTSLPGKALASMPKLISFDISDNQLVQIPTEAIVLFLRLLMVRIHNNPYKDEGLKCVTASTELDALRKALERYAASPSVNVVEASPTASDTKRGSVDGPAPGSPGMANRKGIKPSESSHSIKPPTSPSADAVSPATPRKLTNDGKTSKSGSLSSLLGFGKKTKSNQDLKAVADETTSATNSPRLGKKLSKKSPSSNKLSDDNNSEHGSGSNEDLSDLQRSTDVLKGVNRAPGAKSRRPPTRATQTKSGPTSPLASEPPVSALSMTSVSPSAAVSATTPSPPVDRLADAADGLNEEERSKMKEARKNAAEAALRRKSLMPGKPSRANTDTSLVSPTAAAATPSPLVTSGSHSSLVAEPEGEEEDDLVRATGPKMNLMDIMAVKLKTTPTSKEPSRADVDGGDATSPSSSTSEAMFKTLKRVSKAEEEKKKPEESTEASSAPEFLKNLKKAAPKEDDKAEDKPSADVKEEPNFKANLKKAAPKEEEKPGAEVKEEPNFKATLKKAAPKDEEKPAAEVKEEPNFKATLKKAAPKDEEKPADKPEEPAQGNMFKSLRKAVPKEEMEKGRKEEEKREEGIKVQLKKTVAKEPAKEQVKEETSEPKTEAPPSAAPKEEEVGPPPDTSSFKAVGNKRASFLSGGNNIPESPSKDLKRLQTMPGLTEGESAAPSNASDAVASKGKFELKKMPSAPVTGAEGKTEEKAIPLWKQKQLESKQQQQAVISGEAKKEEKKEEVKESVPAGKKKDEAKEEEKKEVKADPPWKKQATTSAAAVPADKPKEEAKAVPAWKKADAKDEKKEEKKPAYSAAPPSAEETPGDAALPPWKRANSTTPAPLKQSTSNQQIAPVAQPSKEAETSSLPAWKQDLLKLKASKS